MDSVFFDSNNEKIYFLKQAFRVAKIIFKMPAIILPLVKASKKSDAIFKEIGYSWTGTKGHFERYKDHAQKLEKFDHLKVCQDFQANLSMMETIYEHEHSRKTGKKNKEKWATDLLFSNTLTNGEIEKYNKIRQKNIPFFDIDFK